jgi:PAS domain S-box-containing protein
MPPHDIPLPNPSSPDGTNTHRDYERALRESDTRFREAFAYAAIGMALVGLDGQWLQVNDSLCRMLGYTADELRGYTFQELTHPDDLDTDLAYVQQLLNRTIPAYHMEKRYIHKSGEHIWALLSVSLVRDDDDQPLYFIGQVQDMSRQKRAEQAVQEREAWFRALYEQSPDGILLIDPHDATGAWLIVECNTVACTMNGYTRAELIGRPIDCLNMQADTPAGHAAYLDRLRREGTVRYETLHRRKNGTVFPILTSTSLVSISGRELVIGIDRDMTTLKQAQYAQRVSDARYRTLVEQLPAIIYTANIDDTSSTSYVSPQIEAILGFTPTEWLEHPELWLTQTHPDDRTAVLSAVAITHERHEPHAVEYRSYTRDGRLVWLRDMAWVVRDNTGHPLFLQGITLDITERKLAEEAARESEQLYRTMARSFPNGAVFLFDHELRFTLADGEALTDIGLTHDVTEGKTLFEVLSPEVAAVQEPFYRAALAGERRVHELVVGERHFVTYYLPVYDDQKQIFAGLAVAHDITERNRTEQALIEERALLRHRVDERTRDLRAANAALARASALKDEFLANMSHELRTPLNAVLGFAEGIREQSYGPVTERQHYALNAIQESGRHLLLLINDILDVAKIGAGKVELALEPTSVNDVCEASVRMIRQTALKKGVAVQYTADPVVKVLTADMRRLKQILVNLLSNAVKFTPTGGAVGLEVAGDTEHERVHFTVWDTGIGIPSDQLGRLFQPFMQLDSQLARQYEGTGLGLVLVSRLAELHGGGVSVQSELDKGSRFTVSLPWSLQSGASMAEQESIPAHTLPDAPGATTRVEPRTILLVDDNRVSARAIEDYLTTIGHRVLTVHSGEEALAVAQAIHLTVILMDIQMPKMDGLETIQHIRRIASQATTPIIALTALAMPGDRERCLAAGATDYMSKPASLRSLRALIERH